MANKKLSELTTATGQTTSWVIPICDPATGLSYKITASAFSTLIGGGGGDVTAPTVVSATCPNGAANTVVVVFSESVTVTTAGWSAKINGGAWSISSVTGSGTTWTFTMGSSAISTDTLLISYDSTTGATVDGSSNELVSFTDSSVTNSVGGTFGGTALTWGTLASDHEQWNTSLGIRRKATEINDWETQASNVSVSTQTFTGGDRVVFTLADINKTCIVGIINASTPTQLVTSSQFGLTTDDGGGTGLVRAFEGGASVGTTRAGSTSEYYAIYLNSGQIFYQYSTDGVTWTTFYTSLGTPSGTYYCQVQIYQSNFGPNGLYKL